MRVRCENFFQRICLYVSKLGVGDVKGCIVRKRWLHLESELKIFNELVPLPNRRA